ncbi:hypothetical protein JKP88DRAFT_221506 [Tribonema minus]|uniref:PWWP domain-containing protein n=1 Tax=Tribonema minus TaxID=303371 RepID=A0A836CFN4_9STRA|nr:hypothetical protein JKP88DRAFT_221506 [Tribonema minus]
MEEDDGSSDAAPSPGDDGDVDNGESSEDEVSLMPQEYKDKFGDLVWAKMGRYPPWPALIWDPRYAPAGSRKQAYLSLRKKFFTVWFYGNNQYGFISPK